MTRRTKIVAGHLCPRHTSPRCFNPRCERVVGWIPGAWDVHCPRCGSLVEAGRAIPAPLSAADQIISQAEKEAATICGCSRRK